MDVDENAEVAQSLGVQAMPTFIFLKSARKIDELRGGDPRRLREIVTRLATGGSAEGDAGNGGPRLPPPPTAGPPPAPPPEILREAEAETLVEEERGGDGFELGESLGAILDALGWLASADGQARTLAVLRTVLEGGAFPTEVSLVGLQPMELGTESSVPASARSECEYSTL